MIGGQPRLRQARRQQPDLKMLHILICYVVAYGIAQPIAKLIFKHAGVMVLKIISLLSGSILFTIINYFGQRFWVFKEDEK